MEQIILIVHLLLALGIIGLIMLQQGKGADMGASFGAGASQTLFGSGGSDNVLTRATAWLVVLFFASSFGLAILATQKTRVVDDLDLILPPAEEISAPAIESDLPVVDNAAPEAAPIQEGDVPEL
ncbi:preprotein translocase subunit SecG [Parahaliea sp. F7430]|uniref:Protein-export membrane protein SecG n=1 Tax=Sediminihaliea albiluteola TaxID=2758564 RepID=A0A7W2TWA6_9GAMM|nr:preprotein translocase subunit SecG [Sediminihaliea albiluteola]MBA6413109.1 preprotein translocase subunit SecG [Sediminihaliea albiluteola]